jgi:hypothetical protein
MNNRNTMYVLGLLNGYCIAHIRPPDYDYSMIFLVVMFTLSALYLQSKSKSDER